MGRSSNKAEKQRLKAEAEKQKKYVDLKNKYTLPKSGAAAAASPPRSSTSRTKSEVCTAPTRPPPPQSPKSALKGSQSVPSQRKSERVSFGEVGRVRELLAERGDKLSAIENQTEEVKSRSKHMRSLSKKLKDKQAAKLAKSKLPW
eukprot:sb/3473889/